METGVTGPNGVLVVYLAEEEIKHKQEIVLIQHQQMEEGTAVLQTQKQ
jgi:hypothetical protein